MILSLPSWVFIVDSRLRGKDGKFCKGLLDGRGIKGEGEQDNTNTRPVIADLIRNPEGKGHGAYNKTKQPTRPSYWLQGSIHRARHGRARHLGHCGLDPQSRGAGHPSLHAPLTVIPA